MCDPHNLQLSGPGCVRHSACTLMTDAARTTLMQSVWISHGWLVLTIMCHSALQVNLHLWICIVREYPVSRAEEDVGLG